MNKNELRRENLKKMLASRGWDHIKLAEVAKKDPRQIDNILKGRAGFGPKVIKAFAEALGVEEKEFYRWDQSVDTDSLPVDIAQAMNDIKYILTTAKEIQDDWYERIVKGTLNTYREGVMQRVERRELIERLRRIEQKLGIQGDSGTPPAAPKPARKKVA